MATYDERFQGALGQHKSNADARQRFMDMIYAREEAEMERMREEAESANDRSFGGFLKSAITGGAMGLMSGNPMMGLAGAGLGGLGYMASPQDGPQTAQMAGMGLAGYMGARERQAMMQRGLPQAAPPTQQAMPKGMQLAPTGELEYGSTPQNRLGFDLNTRLRRPQV